MTEQEHQLNYLRAKKLTLERAIEGLQRRANEVAAEIVRIQKECDRERFSTPIGYLEAVAMWQEKEGKTV